MLNVVCVKWGSKYGPEYVNRLETMVKRNLTVPFQMYCYTDDPFAISRSIETIPICKEDDLETYWNKLAIFKLFKGKCIYIDLDTVIQNNINDIVNYTNKLTGVYTYWNDIRTDGNFPFATLKWKIQFNSSVLAWTAEDYYWVWDKFMQNRDWNIIKYYGDDKFLGNEIENKQTFPQDWIYTRLYGSKENDTPTEIVKIYEGYHEGWYHLPNYKFCLFNGPTEEKHYKGFEKYWE